MADIDVVDGPPITANKHMILGEIFQVLTNCGWTVAPDNPGGLTAQEVADWSAYRKAWADLGKVNFTNEFNGTDERNPNISPDAIPIPTGWCYTTRCVGELPKLLCRISDLDIVDDSTKAFFDQYAVDDKPKFVCIKPDDFLQYQSHAESMGG